MTKSATITTNTTILTNASPSIHRSTLTDCTLSNLTPSDSITRSVLNAVTITGINSSDQIKPVTSNSAPPPAQPTSTSIDRSSCSTCTITHSHLRHCTLANCTLVKVCSSKSVRADQCSLENITSLRRCTITNSTVGGRSWMTRCDVHASEIGGGSALRRSSVARCRVTGSQLKKARLVDCEVIGCIVVNTDLKGVIIKNGVWRNGSLVGKVVERENIVVVSRDGNGDKKMHDTIPQEVAVVGKAKMEREVVEDSESDTEDEHWDEDDQSRQGTCKEKGPPPPYWA